jgi:hypothetical protein
MITSSQAAEYRNYKSSFLQNFIKANCYAIARAEGVSEDDCEKIAFAFVYPGFRRESQL